MRLQAGISLRRNRQRVGTVEKVLVTGADPEKGLLLGRSQREAPETDGEILFTPGKAGMADIGTFVQVRITAAETYDLKGERV